MKIEACFKSGLRMGSNGKELRMWGESGEWGKEAVRLMPVWEATVIAKPMHLIVGKV